MRKFVLINTYKSISYDITRNNHQGLFVNFDLMMLQY